MATFLEQLKAHTVVVADTGDFQSIKKFRPRDATTNPSLIAAAAKMPEYASVVDDALKFAKKEAAGKSADVDSHSKTESIRLHHSLRGPDGQFAQADEIIDVTDEPNHDELCRREQEVFLRAIRENTDLSAHWQSAIDSLRIVLAADLSFREGRTVKL